MGNNSNSQDKQADQTPKESQGTSQNQQMKKVGDHAMTEAETALIAEVHTSIQRINTAIAKLMCEKHGYPINQPVAFKFDFQNRVAMAYRPDDGGLQVAKDLPDAPAPPTQN